MDLSERLQFFEGVGAGTRGLAEIAGLAESDLSALEAAAERALAEQEPSVAARIYGALVALEPSTGRYALAHVRAAAKAGQPQEASLALEQYLDAELPRPPQELVQALRLRAELVATSDPTAAARDLAAAQAIESRGGAR
jgi:DNA-binding SARP family transcriptional activator